GDGAAPCYPAGVSRRERGRSYRMRGQPDRLPSEAATRERVSWMLLGPLSAARRIVVVGARREMSSFDLIIRGGTLVDGTGGPSRPGDLGIVGERIAAVGRLAADATAARTIDAAGQVVCPGFVDVHGHSDVSLLM